jgi:hypothetical protein
MCSVNGGLSKSNDIAADISGISNDQADQFDALAQGYGFAAFFDNAECLLNTRDSSTSLATFTISDAAFSLLSADGTT